MAYDVVLKFEIGDGTELLNLTITNTSTILGTSALGSCFAGGPIPFSKRGPLEIHIPYLLRQCVALFEIQTEVSEG